jgi:small GTP-binding protein
MLTGPEAGITRDSISVDWEWRGRTFRLADTAGIRRKAKVVGKLEKLSVGDALRTIRFAEVVVIVMDAAEPLEKQDLQLADLVASEGRALVLALNKWDLVAEPQAKLQELNADLEATLTQVRGVPMVPISARTGHGLDRLMETVMEVHATWNKARLHRRAEPLADRHDGTASAARGLGAAHQAEIPDAIEDAAADILPVVLAAGGAAGRLPALSGQRIAGGFRPRRRADPPHAEEGREPVRGTQAEELRACSPARQAKRSKNSNLLDRLGADDDHVLAEALFEFAAVILPPGAVEVFRHDLEDDDLVVGGAGGLVLHWPSAGARVKAVRPPKRSVSSSETRLKCERG